MSSFNNMDEIRRAHDKIARVSVFGIVGALALNFALWGAVIYAGYRVLDHFEIV